MTVPLRAALYLRVSTARQAEHDISIPDHRRQGEAYCTARGYQLVDTYVEPGSTATNDRRPEFQRMIEAGSAKPAPFDIVLVHSFSRFFRDQFELEFYVRKLAKNGCAACGGAMTLRTGKGGRYRYYTCSIKARQGETGCKGRSIPMEKLDDLVAGHIEDRLLQPERLEEVLASVLDCRQERAERRREHVAELNQRAAEAELRLKRLYGAIESGVADLDDPALKERIAGLKSARDQMQNGRLPPSKVPGNRPSRRPWCGSSLRLPANAYGSLPAATAAIIFARSPSASKWRMARSASWGRRAIY